MYREVQQIHVKDPTLNNIHITGKQRSQTSHMMLVLYQTDRDTD